MMRCIVSLFLLLLCACGEDSPTSNDGGSVDKASLIPGEYEGMVMSYSRQIYPALDDTARIILSDDFTAVFTDSAYSMDFNKSPDAQEIERNLYYARQDTLILIQSYIGSWIAGTDGVYLYEHTGKVMTLTLIGAIKDLIKNGEWSTGEYVLFEDEDFNSEIGYTIPDEYYVIYYMRKNADYEEDES